MATIAGGEEAVHSIGTGIDQVVGVYSGMTVVAEKRPELKERAFIERLQAARSIQTLRRF
jgi:hypothetical protein